MGLDKRIIYCGIILSCLQACAFSAFQKVSTLPTRAVSPTGWIKEFLCRQENGLTGHPAAMGFPFNTGLWTEPLDVKQREFPQYGSDWWPYEQTAYYIDGALRVGYLNRSQTLVDLARRNMRYVMANGGRDGMFCIPNVKESGWPLVVFTRAMIEEYENTHDPDLLAALEKHFQAYYKSLDFENIPKGGFNMRLNLNVEHFCKLYEITGKQTYLNHAVRLYENFNRRQRNSAESASGMISGVVPRGHAVTQHCFMLLPPLLYHFTGNEYYLKAAEKGFSILENHHELADGLSSGFESMHGVRSDYVHETCNVSDYIWSAGWMVLASGETHWADKIEKVLFNAGLGSLTKDFKAFQYYSGPNQVVLNNQSSHWNDAYDWGKTAKARCAYRAGHDTECCAGNINRMMPAYIKWMWFTDPAEKTVTAALYGPVDATIELSRDTPIRISEKTNYPFENRIQFDLSMDTPQEFILKLRVPGWSHEYKVYLNDEIVKQGRESGFYAEIKNKFKDGDNVVIEFEAEPVIRNWKKGISLEYGPLVFSLPVKTDVKTMTDLGNNKASSDFPAYEMVPASDWAYAISDQIVPADIKVIKNKMDGYPWDLCYVPVTLRIPAREVHNWKVRNDATPDMPDQLELGTKKHLELKPLGSTLLRITEFARYSQTERVD